MKGFLDYSEGTSILHKMNPLSKMIVALFISISCFLCGGHLFVFGIIILNLVLAAIGKILNRGLGMLKALLKLSIVLFLLQIFFIREGLIILNLPLGLYITDIGLSFSSLLVLRLIGATMPLALMLSLTQMNDLSNVMVEKLGIPYKYAFSLTTAIRFIPVFMNDMQAIMEAQTARGVQFDTKNIIKKIGLILPLCVPLLVSSVKRIEYGALSAELRGFHNRKKNSGYKQYNFHFSDVAALMLSFTLLISAIIL